MAAEAGLGQKDSKSQDQAEAHTFDVQWDVQFFESLHKGDFDCEEGERAELLQLEKELLQAKQVIGERGEKVQAWKEKMESLQASVRERMAKKRKGADGVTHGGAANAEAAPPQPAEGGPPEAAAAPKADPKGPEAQAQIDAEIIRIREAKEAATKAAAAAASKVAVAKAAGKSPSKDAA